MSDLIPPVAILAGGLATRLRPLSDGMPKSLIAVAGEPFIRHQLRLLRRERVTRVVLCVGHLGEMIRDTIGSGADFGVKVSYSFDGEKPLGTGGALRRALPQLGRQFFVLYGDSYLDVAFAPILAAFRRSGAPALMTVYANAGRFDTSNVIFDGERVIRYAKRAPSAEMRYIDYGLGVLTPAALAGWTDRSTFDLADAYSALAAAGDLAGFEVTRRFYEIGTRRGLAEADAYLRGIAHEHQ